MEVRNNFNSVGLRNQKRQAFGNYIIDGQIKRALESQVQGTKKYFVMLNKNNGEHLNNIVTAVGTAAVAPIFIRFNPLSDEDPKVKSYSALRQPLSAVLALSVQLPAMTIFNHGMNLLAASGLIRRIDLSYKPPKALLKAYAETEYIHQKQIAEERGMDFAKILNGRTKADYLDDIINEKRNQLFYARRDKLRDLASKGKPITIAPLYDANGKMIEIDHPTKLSEIKDLEFVKPKELEDAVKSVYPEVLKEFGLNPNDKSIYKIKMDYMAENPKEKYQQLLNAATVSEGDKEYLPKKIKSALKNTGKSYKEFKNTLNQRAQEYAIKKMKAMVEEETLVKWEVSKALDDMKEKFSKLKKNIYHDLSIEMADKEARIKDAEIELINSKIAEFQERAASADPDTVKIMNRAIQKIEGKSLKEIRHHGSTLEAVRTSVKVKKWLLAEINRREGVFANTKKLSGLIYGLAILPFTCGLLNWAYPRFMEKFFPELCVAKKKAKEETYAEINGTIPAQKIDNAKEAK